MTVAGCVCALFLLYPAVVLSAAGLLDCREVETLRGTLTVVRSDSTVLCEGSRYDEARMAAWMVLVFVGLGGPLATGASVLALRRYTCGGSLTAARMIMHFMTGGYRAGAWYWECVVLCRKLFLVVCVTVLGGGTASLLGCLWTLGVALYLTLTLHQFDHRALLYMDVVSLGLTAVMFGLAGIAALLRADAQSPSLRAVASSLDHPAILGSLVGALQILSLTAFVTLLTYMMWKEIRLLLQQMSSRVVAGLCGWCVGDLHATNQSLEQEAAQRLRKLQHAHERYYETLVAEHYAEELIAEISYALKRWTLPSATTKDPARREAQHSECVESTSSHCTELVTPLLSSDGRPFARLTFGHHSSSAVF